MSGFFWVVTIVMTVLALTFLLPTLLKFEHPKTILVAAIALPFFAAGLYWYIGSPQLGTHWSTPSATDTRPAEPSRNATGQNVGSVASMVDGLAERLRENPDDGKSWLLLARSYKHLNRIEDATDAYAKAAALGEVDQELAGLGTKSAAADTLATQIFGNLKLSDRAAAIVLPSDTVFVFARAAGDAGVPAAVLQRPASDLPLDFLLNDSQSMVTGVKLSDFDEVVVTARISRSGNATEALQGLEAKTGPIVVANNNHIQLMIE